jgi:uncharacterized protein YceK
MKIKSMFLIVTIVLVSGCTSIEKNYKPLYQADPEKTHIEDSK